MSPSLGAFLKVCVHVWIYKYIGIYTNMCEYIPILIYMWIYTNIWYIYMNITHTHINTYSFWSFTTGKLQITWMHTAVKYAGRGTLSLQWLRAWLKFRGLNRSIYCYCMCRICGQRTSLWGRYSPSTFRWVPEIELLSSALLTEHFTG